MGLRDWAAAATGAVGGFCWWFGMTAVFAAHGAKPYLMGSDTVHQPLVAAAVIGGLCTAATAVVLACTRAQHPMAAAVAGQCVLVPASVLLWSVSFPPATAFGSALSAGIMAGAPIAGAAAGGAAVLAGAARAGAASLLRSAAAAAAVALAAAACWTLGTTVSARAETRAVLHEFPGPLLVLDSEEWEMREVVANEDFIRIAYAGRSDPDLEAEVNIWIDSGRPLPCWEKDGNAPCTPVSGSPRTFIDEGGSPSARSVVVLGGGGRPEWYARIDGGMLSEAPARLAAGGELRPADARETQRIAEAAADSEALDRVPLGYFRDVLADAP